MIIWYSRLYFRACFYRKQYKPAYFLSGKNLSRLYLFYLYVKFTFFPQLISKVKKITAGYLFYPADDEPDEEEMRLPGKEETVILQA